MAAPNQGANMDQFDAFFQRADLNRDGKISGAEAVSFFQGSNLPKHVLAQIWQFADQARTGFLGRAEFYNALKLVTVAQSKRELTQEIVKAALYGPAAAKIPAPQINLAATPAPQSNAMAVSPTTQVGSAAPSSSQSLGFGGQVVPTTGVNQQYPSSQLSQLTRPPQSMPSSSTAPRPLQGLGPVTTSTTVSDIWMGGRTTRPPSVGGSPSTGISPSTSPTVLTPQNAFQSNQPATANYRAPVVSGNGVPPNTVFGGDAFSAKPSATVKQDFPTPTQPTTAGPRSSATHLVPFGSQPPVKSSSLDSLQSAFSMQPSGNQLQRTQSLSNQNQQVGGPTLSSNSTSNISATGANTTPGQTQASWPKMTQLNVQKYTKVFLEVDTDRDGKITGEQARNLFLSWRLPREILKQVWDLSDQDNDSMLSLKEFCYALYLMERYREGRPLPSVLPNNILFDEALMSLGSQTRALQGNAAWGGIPGMRGYTPGLQPHGISGARPMATPNASRPPLQTSQSGGPLQPHQQNTRGPTRNSPLMSQQNSGEHDSAFSAATDSEKKVDGKKYEILDSREKIEFYRTKMQDLVLYKSRCDNRLNEITERASADKSEAELLGKKYEEKYKQVGEIASKLAIEEAKFRDIQERKMELHQAISKMENGGSADGILQVRADRIQSELEELIRALAERGKKQGLDVKSTALIELPAGWQRNVQEATADWDEDWDKFEDEGFSFAKDAAPNGQVISSPTEKVSAAWNDMASPDSNSTPKSFDADDVSEKAVGSVEHNVHASGPAYARTEDYFTRSPVASPAGKTARRSPSQDSSDNHSVKSTEDAEAHRSFDEPSWGTFDNNDDTDSVWGFNPVNTKESDLEKHRENYFFGSGDPTTNGVRADSPSADSVFQQRSPFTFADSLPGTPLSRPANSPRYSEAGDHFYDNFSRFDSFSMHDGGFSPAPETLTRFDSISSSRDFGQSRGFPSFDDRDPFGSSGPFKVSSEGQTPKKSSENWNNF